MERRVINHRRLILQQNENAFSSMGSFRPSTMYETSSDSSSDDNSGSVDSDGESDSSTSKAPSTASNCRSIAQLPPSAIILPMTIRTSLNTNNDHQLRRDETAANSGGENLPPTPWGSSTTKQRIIAELKNADSDIHLHIGQYTITNFDNVKFPALLQKFAGNKYKPNLFRENMKRLLVHFLNKTGPFEGGTERGNKKSAVEPWYTSAKNVSKAYALLFSLHMNATTLRSIEKMSAEEIWKSSPLFQQYELIKFKEHLKTMSERTMKRRQLIQQEHESFMADMLAFPPNSVTSRGYPFWDTHPACKLLEEDEISGRAATMKPQVLWKSRREYQAFPLSVFRKHIYQLRTKLLAAPYWQFKRNKVARKKYEEDVERMTSEWQHTWHSTKIEDVIGKWNAMSCYDEDN